MKHIKQAIFATLGLFATYELSQARGLGQKGSGAATPGCSPGINAPAPAAANGLGCLVYDLDFSKIKDAANGNALIDTTDSLLPGYDLYIHNAWPGEASGHVVYQTSPATDPNDWTISAGNLVITSLITTPTIAWMFETCGYAPGGLGHYVGQSFLPPWYINTTVSAISGSGTGGPGEWAAWWWHPWEFTSATAPSTFTEVDNGEGPYGRNLHDWNVNAGVTTGLASLNISTNSNSAATYGMLVIPPADYNGSDGLIAPYVNDVLDTTVLGSPGLVVAPGGNFHYVFTQHACPWFNGGYGWSVSFSKQQIWMKHP